jgi:hypothetical protein
MKRCMLAVFLLPLSDLAVAQGCENLIALSKLVSTTVADRPVVEQHAADFCNDYNKSLAEMQSRLEEIQKLQSRLDALAEETIKQCKIQMVAIWGNCAPTQQGNRMPIVETSLTPLKGGFSDWSPWQIASEWNGAPWNCIRTRLYCK